MLSVFVVLMHVACMLLHVACRMLPADILCLTETWLTKEEEEEERYELLEPRSWERNADFHSERNCADECGLPKYHKSTEIFKIVLPHLEIFSAYRSQQESFSTAL